MANAYYCAKCGQRVVSRCGVLLSPRRADVFDAIWRASKRGGIRTDILASMFAENTKCMKVHVYQINQLLAEKGQWRIVCERIGADKGFYRFRRKSRSVAVSHELRDRRAAC